MQKIKMNTAKSVMIDNQKGFTLIELISILVIMGILVSVAIRKYDNISERASITALESGIRELRTRESVTWFKIKLSDTGYTNDAEVFNKVDKNLGQGYIWDPDPPLITGGRLRFQSQSVNLSRTKSNLNSPASWML